MLEALKYGLRKYKGEYNDRREFIEELELDKDELIKDGVLDGNLFLRR